VTRVWSEIPLRWRVFAASSITITALFAVAGLYLERYSIAVADESVLAEMRASIHAYEAVWKTRTQVLSAATALMGAMSDVRAAFTTRDPQTIRDSAQELWSRVSESSAVFLVLDAEGRLISALGPGSMELNASAIPIRELAARFPQQLAGYVRQGTNLFYVVLTPVYVQSSREPVLLDILCAGFRIDGRVASELKHVASDTDFAFVSPDAVFASSLPEELSARLPALASLPSPHEAEQTWLDRFVVSRQVLADISGRPVAQLCVVHSYSHVRNALSRLRKSISIAWLLTIITALLLSMFLTRRLLEPINLLDQAAAQFALRDFSHRVPVRGSGELSRLAKTFNAMCDSIQQAHADLMRQEQLSTIGRLASSLVHDLRNPLAAIYGGAEMLIDGNLPPEHTHRIAENIYRACQRMQALLRDLLNVSKGEQRNVDFFSLHNMIEAAAETLASETSRMRIVMGVEETVEVLCDNTRVERVFTNLISNAAEALPHGGEIYIESERDGDGVAVFVEDTGRGIPPHLRPSLFKPFVTGKRSGLGLGLALSRQTMLDLGGDLSLATPRHGEGACFGLHFPTVRRNQLATSAHIPANALN
jgi:signal transduction histidine kinase